MKRISFRERAIAALTLYAFTLTTISPSLAWAAEREEAAPVSTRVLDSQPAGRVLDAVNASDLEAGSSKAEVASEAKPDVSYQKPNRDDLQNAIGAKGDLKETTETQSQSSDVVTHALPTGGDKSGVTSQAISVPKGSGTIQGMGESFSAQLSTGIATFSVPFALPAARGGAQPALGLSYSSASGSGLAGMGWSVGVPYIARQTDRGLPGYDDRAEWHANQDRFVFNGGQELVPVCTVGQALECAGKLTGEEMPGWAAGGQYFRPRVEGSFLRFFWSTDHRTWRVQDKSGVTMELGVPLDGRGDTTALEVNPDESTQVFRWHLVRQYDTYGDANPASPGTNPTPVNVVVYKYEQSGGQAYLSDIYDTTPKATPTDTATWSGFAHHTHLNYDERTDPTEAYNSGWLIRQTRRLARVDVTSKPMAGPAEARRLVRRYHLEYDGAFHTSYLTGVKVEGRCAGAEEDAPAESGELLGATKCPTLPPMTFEYSHVRGFNTGGTAVQSGLAGYEAFDARIRQIGGDPAHSVDEELSDYFDIDSDGLPDLLVTAPGVYGNDYGVFFNSKGGARDTFGAVDQMGVKGVLGANSGSIKLSNANVAPLDADGDGIIDFLHMPKVKTYSVYHPKLRGKKWWLEGAVVDAANKLSPKVDLGQDAAETRVLDVNFDGLVDVVVSKGTQFETYLSLGRLPSGDMQFGHGEWSSSSSASLSNEPVAKCVPYSGTPVRFSDSDIQLADMNGDGIQDIVRLRRGDVRYWPGRGNGFWGTGKLNDCPAGSFGDKRNVSMDSAPYYSDIQGTSLRMDDVNGDGLDDLVQVRFDAVDVWLNVDGQGWTQRYILDDTVASPSFANRVRLMDINGSGTRDIVWGNGKKYEYIDLAGGERPGLLTKVKNGLGKSTDIEYSTSTAEMLAAERTGVECADPTGANQTFAFDSKWCTKMPTVTHLVKRVTESDNLSVAGSGISQYVTEYGYRDPLYEGRQREFRGFRRARSKRVGDANSPSDFTESTFLLGECEDETPDNGVDECALSERWRDNPREALKGLPVVTERFDADGRYLSTEATTYRLRHLYAGLDGREVRHAFQADQRSVLYDTAAPTSGSDTVTLAPAQVEVELTAPLPSHPDSSWLCAARTEPYVEDHPTAVPLRATTGYAVTRSASVVDPFGNAVMSIGFGCVAGDACPATAPEGNAANESICSYTDPSRPSGDPTGWLYRTTQSWVRGSAQSDIRKHSTTEFSAQGAPTKNSVTVAGTVALDRFHTTAGQQVQANPPATASADGLREVGRHEYDVFGNLTKETGAPGLGRCRTVTYDVNSYQQLPMSETIFSRGCDTDDELQTGAGYDRGLGQVVTVTDLNEQVTSVEYDGFGRLIALYRPGIAQPAEGQSALPSVKIEYSLPSAQDPRAYSIIHTSSQDGALETNDEYLESYSFVDGMGRARVGLSEADPTEDGASWIVSSIAEFDAKGAVRRKYLPFFLPSDATAGSFPVGDAAPDTQYGRQRYDAFGRQIQTFDVDGTVTLQSRYHALSTDLWDAADLYPGPHQGSYASTRTDGHGRSVETTERVHDAGVLSSRYVRMQYLPTGEPTVITRVKEGAQSVVRWMRYDSLGRLVLNVDPHTTGNFTIDTNISATPVAGTGLKAWRYAYNDAGDLVGTSDARGCGQNFHYDGAGRLYGEDYSPCTIQHDFYTSPSFDGAPYDVSALSAATIDKFEVFYQFDKAPTAPVTPPTEDDGYTDAAKQYLNGKLAAVHDRGATTWFAYDLRGRTTTTFRKVAFVNVRGSMQPIAPRYINHWYSQTLKYDAADRSVEQSTGVSSAELKARDGTSAVKTAYTKRGTIKNVDSSYGELVKGIKRSAEGLVQSMTLGDAASTQTAMRYDSRRRLASVQTFRSAASLWSTAPPDLNIAPSPTAGDATRQLLLQDLDYSYDVVGNPTEIRDWRTPEEWPEGAKPVSRRMEYDDLYRVTRVDYDYPGGSDKWTSPFAADVPTIDDSRRQRPTGQRVFSKRPLWQTYKYDWLGNTTFTDDDQHALYDRSLGTVSSYATSSQATSKPYQFKESAVGATQVAKALAYDAAGNLTWFTSGRTGVTCTKQADCTNLQYFYTWDEVGRLVYAGRLTSVGPFLRYLYDWNDERVVKEYRELLAPPDATTAGPPTLTLYVFDSLEIRRAVLDTVTKQVPVDSTTEVGYLSANGMRLGRLHYEQPAKGEPKLSTDPDAHWKDLHILLNLPDHLGSSSMIIDHASGELVEARTYQPYGATESDYRPERWKGFREDYGFTGKEEDTEVGLIYFGKRFLSPYLGRWISADPLAVHVPGEADLNLYAYVGGTILRNIDPVGLSCPKGAMCNEGAGGGQSADADRDAPEEEAREAERRAKAEAQSKEEDDRSKAFWAGVKSGFKHGFIQTPTFDGLVGPEDPRAKAIEACGEPCAKYREAFEDGFGFGFGGGVEAGQTVQRKADQARMGPGPGVALHDGDEPHVAPPPRAAPKAAPKAPSQSAAEKPRVVVQQHPAQQQQARPPGAKGTPSAARGAVLRDQGPPGITRIDRPDTNVKASQWEAHTGGKGSPALLLDGTWKHVQTGKAPPKLPRETYDWLRNHGWKI